MDAAILYSDIVVPTHAIGFGVDIVPGVGPVVERPFREARDLDRLRPLDPDADTPYVLETVGNLVAELDVPLIAFAGAPFTMASYLVEGGPSRTHALTKRFMHSEPDLWTALMDRLADLAIASIGSQLDAGAAAFQLFDSWAGALAPDEYRQFVLPASQRVFAELGNRGDGAPGIHFGVGTGELLELLAKAGADVVGGGLASASGRRSRAARPRCGRAGQLGSRRGAGPVAGGGRPGHRRAGSQRRPAGSRVQPGPRRVARDRSRDAGTGGGVGTRVRGDPMKVAVEATSPGGCGAAPKASQ